MQSKNTKHNIDSSGLEIKKRMNMRRNYNQRTIMHTAQIDKRIKDYKLAQPTYNFEHVNKKRIEDARSKYNN